MRLIFIEIGIDLARVGKLQGFAVVLPQVSRQQLPEFRVVIDDEGFFAHAGSLKVGNAHILAVWPVVAGPMKYSVIGRCCGACPVR